MRGIQSAKRLNTHIKNDARQLRSADTRTLTVHRTSSCFGDRTFAASATRVWNSMPSDLRKADLSYSRFKRSLKTFLFGEPDHGALWTLLTVPCRNILTYLLTKSLDNVKPRWELTGRFVDWVECLSFAK